jgi:hypothetical protein
MVDPGRQRRKIEELKRKTLNDKNSSSQDGLNGSIRPEDDRETTKGVVNLMQGNGTEDDMWEAQGYSESDEDRKASEAGQRRLEALEKELHAEEEQLLQDRARVRAEELKKKQSQDAEKHRSTEATGDIKVIPPERSELSPAFHGDSSQIYLEALQLAYRDGILSKTEADILDLLRKRFGLTEKQHSKLQQKVQLEIYSQAMVDAWRNGVVTQEEVEKLDLLREQLNISAEDHLRFERQVRRQALRRSAFSPRSDVRI